MKIIDFGRIDFFLFSPAEFDLFFDLPQTPPNEPQKKIASRDEVDSLHVCTFGFSAAGWETAGCTFGFSAAGWETAGAHEMQQIGKSLPPLGDRWLKSRTPLPYNANQPPWWCKEVVAIWDKQARHSDVVASESGCITQVCGTLAASLHSFQPLRLRIAVCVAGPAQRQLETLGNLQRISACIHAYGYLHSKTSD